MQYTYEYAIGKASSGGYNQAYLFYMIFVGSSSSGGSSSGDASIGVLDYVYKTNNVFPDLTLDTYAVTSTRLDFIGSNNAASTGMMCFSKFSSDNKVHYYNNIAGITITDSVSGNPYLVHEITNVFPFAGFS